jgi:ferredoxin
MLKRIFGRGGAHEAPSPTPRPGTAQVAADASRCVQCGICGFNCPVGIEVRDYAHRGLNVTDSRCIGCGACIEKCPRGTLRWGPPHLLGPGDSLEIDPTMLPLTLQLLPREIE